MSMRPSEVRAMILEDHEALRQLLAEVEELTGRRGEPGLAERLRSRGGELRRRFLAHLSLEDTYLVPALREADGWGDERAHRVEVEHRDQRERMEALLERLEDSACSTAELAAELAALAADLRADMEGEEQAVLDENLLRDDPVAIDVETG